MLPHEGRILKQCLGEYDARAPTFSSLEIDVQDRFVTVQEVDLISRPICEQMEYADMEVLEGTDNAHRVRHVAICFLGFFNCVLLTLWFINLSWIDQHLRGRLKFAGHAGDCMSDKCFLDEFSITHFGHGFVIFYWLAVIPLRHCRWFGLSIGFDWLGFHVVAMLEVAWELLENSEAVVKALRQSGKNNADYYGDSLANSLGDQVICLVGYVCMEWICLALGQRIALLGGVANFFVSEIVLYLWTCDGLVILWVNLARPGSVTCKVRH